jgi:hypothetical protein
MPLARPGPPGRRAGPWALPLAVLGPATSFPVALREAGGLVSELVVDRVLRAVESPRRDAGKFQATLESALERRMNSRRAVERLPADARGHVSTCRRSGSAAGVTLGSR